MARTLITGATLASYTPVAADIGMKLVCVATGSGNYQGSVEATTNNATACKPLTSLTLSDYDPERTGMVLTTTLTPSDGTVTYQWYRNTGTGGAWEAISGATESTYTTVAADVGYKLRVVATGTGDYLGAEVYVETIAAATTSVTGVSLSSTSPKFGTAVTATATPSGATVSWQWYRGDSASTATTAISGATSATYTPVADDVGKYLKAVATGTGYFTDSAFATSTARVTRALVKVTLSSTGSLSAPLSGDKLTATLDPSVGTATYQWRRGDGTSWTNISGATSATYTATDADAGKKLNCLATGSGNYTGSVNASTSAIVKITLAGIAISPTAPVFDELVTASLTQTSATVSWQWYRGDTASTATTAISGATAKTYTPVGDDVGKYLKAVATATGNYSGSVNVVSTAAVARKALVSVGLTSDSPMVGTALSATNIVPEGATVTYQWYRVEA